MSKNYVQADPTTPELQFNEHDMSSVERFSVLNSSPIAITFARLKRTDSDQTDLCAISMYLNSDGKITAEPFAVILEDSKFNAVADQYEPPSELFTEYLNNTVATAAKSRINEMIAKQEFRNSINNN